MAYFHDFSEIGKYWPVHLRYSTGLLTFVLDASILIESIVQSDTHDNEEVHNAKTGSARTLDYWKRSSKHFKQGACSSGISGLCPTPGSEESHRYARSRRTHERIPRG